MNLTLKKNQIDNFKKTGILKIKNFFKNEEISTIRNNLINSLKGKNSFDCYYEKLKGKKFLRRIEKLSENSKDFSSLLNNKNLKRILKELSSKKQYLFKDKLNFKYSKSKGFNKHIDGHWYWHNNKNKKELGWKKYGNDFLNVVIPLENVFKKWLSLFKSKKYTFKFLGRDWKKIAMGIAKNKSILNRGFKFKPYPMNIGDILIFNWKVCHYSKKIYPNILE